MPREWAVTGVPAAEIANCVARLEDLLGTAARDVGARLADAASHEARFALLDDFLMRRLYVARPLDHAVLWARKQLARGEWFGHVVIGAKLEAHDPVCLFVQASEHDDRDV